MLFEQPKFQELEKKSLRHYEILRVRGDHIINVNTQPQELKFQTKSQLLHFSFHLKEVRVLIRIDLLYIVVSFIVHFVNRTSLLNY